MLVTLFTIVAGYAGFTATGRTKVGATLLAFPNVTYNEGNDYNASTGVFTCRIPGQYWFSVSLTKHYNDINTEVFCFLSKNDRNWLSIYHKNPHHHDISYSLSASGGVHLRPGDRIRVADCNHPEAIYASTDTHFSGMLINPDY